MLASVLAFTAALTLVARHDALATPPIREGADYYVM
jgi:hypothetical protein